MSVKALVACGIVALASIPVAVEATGKHLYFIEPITIGASGDNPNSAAAKEDERDRATSFGQRVRALFEDNPAVEIRIQEKDDECPKEDDSTCDTIVLRQGGEAYKLSINNKVKQLDGKHGPQKSFERCIRGATFCWERALDTALERLVQHHRDAHPH